MRLRTCGGELTRWHQVQLRTRPVQLEKKGIAERVTKEGQRFKINFSPFCRLLSDFSKKIWGRITRPMTEPPSFPITPFQPQGTPLEHAQGQVVRE